MDIATTEETSDAANGTPGVRKMIEMAIQTGIEITKIVKIALLGVLNPKCLCFRENIGISLISSRDNTMDNTGINQEVEIR